MNKPEPADAGFTALAGPGDFAAAVCWWSTHWRLPPLAAGGTHADGCRLWQLGVHLPSIPNGWLGCQHWHAPCWHKASPCVTASLVCCCRRGLEPRPAVPRARVHSAGRPAGCLPDPAAPAAPQRLVHPGGCRHILAGCDALWCIVLQLHTARWVVVAYGGGCLVAQHAVARSTDEPAAPLPLPCRRRRAFCCPRWWPAGQTRQVWWSRGQALRPRRRQEPPAPLRRRQRRTRCRKRWHPSLTGCARSCGGPATPLAACPQRCTP